MQSWGLVGRWGVGTGGKGSRGRLGWGEGLEEGETDSGVPSLDPSFSCKLEIIKTLIMVQTR